MIIKIQISNLKNLSLQQPYDANYLEVLLRSAKQTKKRFFDSIRKIFVDYDRIYIYTNLQLSSTTLSVITSFFVGLINKESLWKPVVECTTGVYPDTEDFESGGRGRYDMYVTFHKTKLAKDTLFGNALEPVAWNKLPESYREGVTI